MAFVGIGPGAPGLVTVHGAQLLAAADVIVSDRGTTPTVVALHARPEVAVLDARRPLESVDASVDTAARDFVRAVLDAVAQASGVREPLVVRLVDGDASISGDLQAELTACLDAGLSVEIVPGVAAATATPTYAGIPLGTPDSPTLVLHGASQGPGWQAAVSPEVTVVVVGTSAEVADGLRSLSAAGRDGAADVALVLAGSTTAQRTDVITLAQAPERLSAIDALDDVVAVVGEGISERPAFGWFESLPLFGWRVLVPRTQDQAGPMLGALARYGAVGEVVPTIGVEPPRSPAQMDKAIAGLVTGRYEWVGFTSVNAVRAVREKFAELGLDARAFAGLKIAAVGGVTAQALRDMGLTPDLVPTGEQSARGLLEQWPPYDPDLDPINGVFLPRADIATDTLVAGLQEMGWEVDDVTAYRTVRAAPPPAPVREAIKKGDFDAVAFTSSSTVRNLVGIAGKPHPSTVVACIGPATARTATELGLTVSVIADEASAVALVDALAAFGRARSESESLAGARPRRPSQTHAKRRRKA